MQSSAETSLQGTSSKSLYSLEMDLRKSIIQSYSQMMSKLKIRKPSQTWQIELLKSKQSSHFLKTIKINLHPGTKAFHPTTKSNLLQRVKVGQLLKTTKIKQVSTSKKSHQTLILKSLKPVKINHVLNMSKITLRLKTSHSRKVRMSSQTKVQNKLRAKLLIHKLTMATPLLRMLTQKNRDRSRTLQHIVTS